MTRPLNPRSSQAPSPLPETDKPALTLQAGAGTQSSAGPNPVPGGEKQAVPVDNPVQANRGGLPGAAEAIEREHDAAAREFTDAMVAYREADDALQIAEVRFSAAIIRQEAADEALRALPYRALTTEGRKP